MIRLPMRPRVSSGWRTACHGCPWIRVYRSIHETTSRCRRIVPSVAPLADGELPTRRSRLMVPQRPASGRQKEVMIDTLFSAVDRWSGGAWDEAALRHLAEDLHRRLGGRTATFGLV